MQSRAGCSERAWQDVVSDKICKGRDRANSATQGKEVQETPRDHKENGEERTS